MDAIASECSSGCESGWTLYLEQSSLSPNSAHIVEKKMSDSFCDKRDKNMSEEENEEDLSMVSDASSGPPHFSELDQTYFNYETTTTTTTTTTNKLMNNNGGISRRKKDQRKNRRCEKQEAFLDDTASSQNNFCLPNNHASMESIVDYSQQFSTTHFQGRSAYQESFSYLHPALSGNQLQNNQWY